MFYCSEAASNYTNDEFTCDKHFKCLNSENTIKIIFLDDVPKTRAEIILNKKYMKLLSKFKTPEEHSSILPAFKADVRSVRAKNKLYVATLLACVFIFTQFSFSQEGIVVAGGTNENISYTIGAGLVDLQIPYVKEVSLGVPVYEFPTIPEQPKPNQEKKKSLIQKIIAYIQKLIKTKKR